MDCSIDIGKQKLDLLEKKILQLGKWAVEKQKDLHVRYKEDKSPVTEVDLTISGEIIKTIRKLFPGCGIITEEEETGYTPEAPFTFVLDPIDGTDVYSQGLPSFCIALGILDSSFSPVGSICYAPRFGRGTDDGLLLRLNPGEKPTINGEELMLDREKKENGPIWQLTVSSSLVKIVDFSSYSGKIRIFGSQILQILSPALFCNITASINEPCYIWDYASAHAIIKSLGMDLYTPSLEPFTYSQDFLSRRRCSTITYGGFRNTVEKLVGICPPLNENKEIIHN